MPENGTSFSISSPYQIPLTFSTLHKMEGRGTASGGPRGRGSCVAKKRALGERIVEKYWNGDGHFVELIVNDRGGYEFSCKICKFTSSMSGDFGRHFENSLHTSKMDMVRSTVMKPNALVWPFDDGNQFFHGRQGMHEVSLQFDNTPYGFTNVSLLGTGVIGSNSLGPLLVFCTWHGMGGGSLQAPEKHKYGIITFSYYTDLGIQRRFNMYPRRCGICYQAIYHGKDCSTFYHIIRGGLLCSSGHKPWFCVFHTSCLVHWFLVLENANQELFCPDCSLTDWGTMCRDTIFQSRRRLLPQIRDGKTDRFFSSSIIQSLEANVIGLELNVGDNNPPHHQATKLTKEIVFYRASEKRDDLDRRGDEYLAWKAQQSGEASCSNVANQED